MTAPFLFRGLLALAAVVGLVACTYPNGLSAAVRDLRDYAAITDEMSELSDHDAEMTARSAELRDRVAAKEAVIQDVINGRLSLTDAAARFGTLNGDDPQARRFLDERYDGSTLDEKLARNVIDHVSANRHLWNRHQDAHDRALARLDRQFRERYGHPR